MDYIHITLQKYTFSLKQQIFEADFLENRSDFSKIENTKMRGELCLFLELLTVY